jgi:hypothetical protein
MLKPLAPSLFLHGYRSIIIELTRRPSLGIARRKVYKATLTMRDR